MKSQKNNHLEGKGKTIELLLPGHRGPFAVNDFREIETKAAEKEIVTYLCRAACPFIRYKGGEILLRLPEDAPQDHEAEQITERAYRDMLVEWSDDAWSNALRLVPKTLVLILFGATLLIISHFLEAEQEGTLWGALGGLLQVASWIALWTAISALAFQATTYWRNSITLRRLSQSPIRFHYADVKPHERFNHKSKDLAPVGMGEENGMP